MTNTPLNGSRTHALSDFARNVLRKLARRPIPSMEVNPGVADRLMRGGLVEVLQLTSPFAKHKGGTCNHLCITDTGRAELENPTQ